MSGVIGLNQNQREFFKGSLKTFETRIKDVQIYLNDAKRKINNLINDFIERSIYIQNNINILNKTQIEQNLREMKHDLESIDRVLYELHHMRFYSIRNGLRLAISDLIKHLKN